MKWKSQKISKRIEQGKKRVIDECVCCGNKTLKSSPAILMPFISHRIFGWAPTVIDDSWGLLTINTGVAYSICSSLFCADCRFLFLDMRFSEEELEKLYDDYRGEKYNALREFYEPGYTERNESLNAGIEYLREIEKFLEPYLTFPLTILDWGGDTGKNTPFREKNSSLDIYDISKKNVTFGANQISKEEAFEKKYDLVVCSNVLEHVSFPSDLLSEIVRAMDSGSILYIETPLEDLVLNGGDDLHLKKKHWHEHINFFSEQSLRSLVQNVGLEVLSLDSLQIMSGAKKAHVFQLACRLSQN
jgi:SAM-dependent methyltransferase